MKSFSELTSASQVNNADLLAISQSTGNDYASKKTTVKDIADFSNKNLAEEYDSTSTYAVDDYVIYESVLYKCIATTTGAFDSTKWTSVVVTDEMGSGGGGGGGHVIKDDDGTSLTQRANLQFVGTYSEDDSVNSASVVNVTREMTRADFDLLSADEKKGLILITDEDESLETMGELGTLSPTTDETWVSLFGRVRNAFGLITDENSQFRQLKFTPEGTLSSMIFTPTKFVKNSTIIYQSGYATSGESAVIQYYLSITGSNVALRKIEMTSSGNTITNLTKQGTTTLPALSSVTVIGMK